MTSARASPATWSSPRANPRSRCGRPSTCATGCRRCYPACDVELLGITTQGDRVLDRPLADIGGKGLFIKELESRDGRRPRRPRRAFAEGRADGHAGWLRARGDHARARIRATRSCPIAIATLAELPAGASSARRACAARRSCASAIRSSRSQPLRGNVNTRAAQARRGPVRRDHPRGRRAEAAGLAPSASRRCSIPTDSLPAVGQGALALECRADRADVIARARAARRSRDDARDHRRARLLRARFRAAATRRSPRYADGRRRRAVAARPASPAATARDVMRGERDAVGRRSPMREALGRALADEFLARGAAAMRRRRGVIDVTGPPARRAASVDHAAGAGMLVTRPARRRRFARASRAGAPPIIFPAIVDPAAGRHARRSTAHAALAQLRLRDLRVSANAVEYGVAAIQRVAARMCIAFAPGPGTAEALAAVGIADVRYAGDDLRQRRPARAARARRRARQARR